MQKIAIWAQSHNFGASTLYISGALAPERPALAALLHGTPASAKLCAMVQGTLELQNFCRVRHRHSAWRPSRWASAYILVA